MKLRLRGSVDVSLNVTVPGMCVCVCVQACLRHLREGHKIVISRDLSPALILVEFKLGVHLCECIF